MQLLRFLVSRISNAVLIALLVPLLSLFLLGRAPGDYLSDLAANPQVSSNTLAQLRLQYGLDQPLQKKYFSWLSNIATGDLGFSFVYQRPIRELIGGRVWNTVLLNGAALGLAWIFGIAISLAAAEKRGLGWVAGWSASVASTLLVSTPTVLLALVLLALAIPLGLPVGGMGGWKHLILPVCAVSAVWLPVVIRHARAALDQALREPYIATARAKGVTRTRVLVHHALRNALNPLTALFGLSVSALLSASLPVEVIMGWPGIGQLTYDAVLKRDIFLVMDLAMVSALLLLAGNLLGDLLAYLSDPRVRQ
jgi:peptide/nickel transport system permease protein